MAIQIISGNLNSWGNSGQFETDPSTWGFGSSTFVNISRSNLFSSAGLRSLQAKVLGDTPFAFEFITAKSSPIAVTTGKKYIAKAKVRVSQSAPPGENGVIIRIKNILGTGLTDIVYTDLTVDDIAVADSSNTWFDIETTFAVTADVTLSTLGVYLVKNILDTDGDQLLTNGILYVDQFEVYEYIDTEEPEPEPPEDYTDIYFSKDPIPFTLNQTDNGDEDNYRIQVDVRVEDESGSNEFNST
jgi:hypothetical protein